MVILNLILIVFLSILFIQLLAYIYAISVNRVDIVDSIWGLSFIAGLAGLQIIQPNYSAAVLIIDGLVSIWGLRLFWHIYRRFYNSSHQDSRYTSLMARWPKRWVKTQIFMKIFFTQTVLATLISLSIIAVHASNPGISWALLAGVLIWCVGFIFEVIADKQLKDFLIKPNRPQLMTEGLWKYSRHPNYFGEITMWWGIATVALSTPVWWLGLFGASVITVLICLVSGIPPAEKQAAIKPGWEAYKSKTSALIPWLPK